MSVNDLREDISAEALIREVMEHVNDYQELVDKCKRKTTAFLKAVVSVSPLVRRS